MKVAVCRGSLFGVHTLVPLRGRPGTEVVDFLAVSRKPPVGARGAATQPQTSWTVSDAAGYQG